MIPQQDLQRFTCADWNDSDDETRETAVRRFGEIAQGQVTGKGIAGTGAALTDDQAGRLFDARCEPPYARGFILYKLYGQAVGLAGGAPRP